LEELDNEEEKGKDLKQDCYKIESTAKERDRAIEALRARVRSLKDLKEFLDLRLQELRVEEHCVEKELKRKR